MKRDSSPSRAAPTSPGGQSPSITPLPPLFGNFRSLMVATGLFLVVTLSVFGDVLFNGGDRILSLANQDVYNVFVGWLEFTSAQMKAGNLPLWNPHLYGGAPCLGGFQEALLYPSTWLHLILPLPQAINWGIALHVFLAGLFTYMWMARRGLHPLAAIVSGLIFMFGGGYFLHIVAGHLPNLQTMVWAPLIFLAIDDLTCTRSLRGAWLGAGAVMMQVFAGHPQYVYYTALIAGPYALVGLWNAPSRRNAIAGMALMAIGGIALSAVQLFTVPPAPAANHLLKACALRLNIQVAGTFAFPPENLLTLFVPGFFGSISDGFYWGRWLLWEDSLFIGFTGLALAIYGAIRGGRSRGTPTLVAFLLATVLVALGSYTPLYTLLFHVLPGFGSFRGVSKIAFLAALFFAGLAGVGLDRLIRMPTISAKPAILIAAIALAIAMAAAFSLDLGECRAARRMGTDDAACPVGRRGLSARDARARPADRRLLCALGPYRRPGNGVVRRGRRVPRGDVVCHALEAKDRLRNSGPGIDRTDDLRASEPADLRSQSRHPARDANAGIHRAGHASRCAGFERPAQFRPGRRRQRCLGKRPDGAQALCRVHGAESGRERR